MSGAQGQFVKSIRGDLLLSFYRSRKLGSSPHPPTAKKVCFFQTTKFENAPI